MQAWNRKAVTMPNVLASTIFASLLACGMSGSCFADPQAVATGRSAVHHHHRKPAHAVRPKIAALPAAPAAPSVASAGPAPVPNEALTPPIDNTAQETKVAPSVFSLHYPNQGDGYVTGSSPQAMDDRNAARATGVEMKVPLPQ